MGRKGHKSAAIRANLHHIRPCNVQKDGMPPISGENSGLFFPIT